MSENIARYLNLPDYIVDMYDELCYDMINDSLFTCFITLVSLQKFFVKYPLREMLANFRIYTTT
jgi:hypothetical protein